jgi:hypothetical protein
VIDCAKYLIKCEASTREAIDALKDEIKYLTVGEIMARKEEFEMIARGRSVGSLELHEIEDNGSEA